jgi:hypothetical protein
MSPTTPLLPGTLELVVLQLLQAEPTNGYERESWERFAGALRAILSVT